MNTDLSQGPGHIHIYFNLYRFFDDPTNEQHAKKLAQDIKAAFPNDTTGIWRVGIVGPHLQPNYEVEVSQNIGLISEWLEKNGNGNGLSILLHPVTNDERKDHLEDSKWFGQPIGLKDGFFDRPQPPVRKAPIRPPAP